MSGLITYASSATDYTLPAPDGACFTWITNTGAAPINVSPYAGTTHMLGQATIPVPVGASAKFTYYPGAAYWQCSGI